MAREASILAGSVAAAYPGGKIKLVELKGRTWASRSATLAERFPARSVRLARTILIRASRNAMVDALAARTVADLAVVPAGLPGAGLESRGKASGGHN